MTNKEAIAILERLQEPEAWEPQISEDAYTALEMAIDALGADTNVGSKGDMIYRQDAIHVVSGLDSSFVKYIEELPSAQPEQKWIPVSKELPKTNVLVWVTDLHQHVSACQVYTDISDWYSESDEWMYKHDSIIAWKPYIVPEPYKEKNNE